MYFMLDDELGNDNTDVCTFYCGGSVGVVNITSLSCVELFWNIPMTTMAGAASMTSVWLQIYTFFICNYLLCIFVTCMECDYKWVLDW
jgi:hypothetical protein